MSAPSSSAQSEQTNTQEEIGLVQSLNLAPHVSARLLDELAGLRRLSNMSLRTMLGYFAARRTATDKLGQEIGMERREEAVNRSPEVIAAYIRHKQVIEDGMDLTRSTYECVPLTQANTLTEWYMRKL
ncbi:hypothetical protein DL89DRAFT_270040, partial [Linderina pennispora]